MIYQNGKYKRRRITTKLNYPKLQHEEETTLTLCIFPSSEPQWVLIGQRGTKRSVRSRTSNLGAWLHKIATETRHLPCFCDNAWEARAAPPAARFPDVPLSAILTGFQIWAPGFDKTDLQGQWLYYRPLITH